MEPTPPVAPVTKTWPCVVPCVRSWFTQMAAVYPAVPIAAASCALKRWGTGMVASVLTH